MEFTRPRLASEVVERVEELLKQGFSYSNIRKQTGVSQASISKIKNGTYKKAEPIKEVIDLEIYNNLLEEYKVVVRERDQLKKNSFDLKNRKLNQESFNEFNQTEFGKKYRNHYLKKIKELKERLKELQEPQGNESKVVDEINTISRLGVF